jgi:hypothetical protein
MVPGISLHSQINHQPFQRSRQMMMVFPNPDAIENLQLELSLLRILHHRNKNQHHLQPFFRHLSILKRTLSLLLQHPDSEYLRHKAQNVVILRAWEEFSRIVARGEFVALGLVLCASVARIAYCLGGVEEKEATSQGKSEEYETMGDEDELGEVIPREAFLEDRMGLGDVE